MTLREWVEAHPGTVLDGVVLRVPPYAEGLAELPQRELALRSVWSMPPDHIGLWMMVPEDYRAGVGQTFPITHVRPDDVMAWEVVE